MWIYLYDEAHLPEGYQSFEINIPTGINLLASCKSGVKKGTELLEAMEGWQSRANADSATYWDHESQSRKGYYDTYKMLANDIEDIIRAYRGQQFLLSRQRI